MTRLTQTDGLTDEQRDILGAVREFVDEEILPVATELDHADQYWAYSGCPSPSSTAGSGNRCSLTRWWPRRSPGAG